ncbi:hypothetical protein OY671_008158, partial [Metschnikowia pulcherrima]
ALPISAGHWRDRFMSGNDPDKAFASLTLFLACADDRAITLFERAIAARGFDGLPFEESAIWHAARRDRDRVEKEATKNSDKRLYFTDICKETHAPWPLMSFELEIENFFSIRDKQVVDSRVAANAPDLPGRLSPIWPGASDRAPKVVAIFGPNEAGKSTILRALSFIAWFARESFQLSPTGRLPYERFNSVEGQSAPTRSSSSFGGHSEPEDETSPACRYTYSLESGGSNAAQQVVSEASHYWPEPARRKVRLFERSAEGKVVAASA